MPNSLFQETYLAKHMQKHSDRPDKRPPVGMNQGGVPGANAGQVGHGGGHGGVGGQNNLVNFPTLLVRDPAELSPDRTDSKVAFL